MYRRIRSRLVPLVSLLAVLCSLFPAFPVQASSAPPRITQEDSADAVRPASVSLPYDIARDDWGYISVRLDTDGAPSAGGVATLTLAATPGYDAASIQFDWQLPDGGEILGGSSTESTGPVAKGTTVQSVRQVRFPADGIYRAMASATVRPNDSVLASAVGALFFIVNAAAPAVGDKDPAAVNPRTILMEPEIVSAEAGRRVVDPATVDAASISETDDPCFTVSGRVLRTEVRINSAGAVTTTGEPVANAVIEMREEDTLFDDSYGTMLTRSDGSYSFSFCDDDGVFDDELELYVRLRAELRDGSFSVVEIVDSSWIDETYEFDSGIIESEGGKYTINFNLDMTKSAIFNIADAVWMAWRFWNVSGGDSDGSKYFDHSAEVHWEPGYGDDGSYYQPTWSEITIADDASDPDEWDDSVIMHEWGHMADDYHGCDDNPGGEHSVDQLIDPELAWGEGYPDYWQSAVRRANSYTDAQFYMDRNGMGTINQVNLETFDSTRMDSQLTGNHEFAVAAMLWDLTDTNNDGRVRGGNPATGPWDTVSNDHRQIQRVYTGETFESNGDIFDDTCTAFVYLLSWAAMGLPTDAATAEAVVKNVNIANPFGTASAASAVSAAEVEAAGGVVAFDTVAADLGQSIRPADSAAILAAPTGFEDYQWWKRVTMIVDNSASMAGQKLDGIKTLVKEQANDLAPDPDGVRFGLYTFNNLSLTNTPRFNSLFRSADVGQAVDQVGASSAADPNCQTNGLRALATGAQTMRGGQAWLYTDGDSVQNLSNAAMKQVLNGRGVRGSVVLLVGCSSLPPSMPNRSGAEIAYLGNAANASQPTGIVPYLLTALGSGGQFFYVNQDQLGNIGDVLRAQLGHSAGAGKWSDYVSDGFTYRWDRLDPSDYQWFPVGLSTEVGQLADYRDVPLGGTFNFWGTDYANTTRIYQNGYLTLGSTYLELLRAPLSWNVIPVPPRAASEGEAVVADATINETVTSEELTTDAPDIENMVVYTDPAILEGPPEEGEVSPAEIAAECYPGNDHYGTQLKLFRAYYGIDEWIIFTWAGETDLANTPCRYFQVWLNQRTGEIRYIYDRVYSADSGAARIALLGPSTSVVVSNSDTAGASSGMGYYFTPAPPQPTKTHTVTVDSLMSSIGFLQTGYSGNFEPMIVRTPDGTAVNCADTADVLCLTVDNVAGDRMVQYVQVNVNGRTGVWSATIDAGSGGSSTYSFTAMAASEVEAQGNFDMQRPSFKSGSVLVNMGRPAAGNTLTGWITKPSGERWGSPYTLYDDGAHGDGQAGDGQFGSTEFTSPGEGVGYLWVQGTFGGQQIQRMVPSPISFQPLELRSLDTPIVANNGAAFILRYSMQNGDNVRRCYNPTYALPDGWGAIWNPATTAQFPYICLNAGQLFTDYIIVYPDWTALAAEANASEAGAISATSGSMATVGLSLTDLSNNAIADAVETQIMLTKPAAQVAIDERPFGHYLRANGTDAISVTVQVLDAEGFAVADGTEVTFATTGGVLGHTTLTTLGGKVTTTLTAAYAPGDATVTATSNGFSDSKIAHFRNPIANNITLSATPVNLQLGKTSNLIVSVTDAWGNPVSGAKVRLGVNGDGQSGAINGNEMIAGTTNASGQVAATYTRAGIGWGAAIIHAELLKPAEAGDDVAQRATIVLTMGAANLPGGGRGVIFLPTGRK